MKTVLTIFILCIFVISLQSNALAKDSLDLPTQTISGRFEAVTDGLITIKDKGVSKTYIRTDNPFDIYSDYIIYRNSPFSKVRQSGPCKVVFVDTFVVKIKLPNSSNIEIPRYRVNDLTISIKN